MRTSILLILFFLAPAFAEIQSPPEWVAHAVFYQIFPERFNNGDTANDPTLASEDGAWPHDVPGAWHISPWTSDWYKLQPWEKANGKGFGYNAQRRRYGGDIRGIIDKLDYLKNLGITAIYINPVFFAPSLHKYDAACYHHIDPYFGPDPAGDLKIMRLENPIDPQSWRMTAADMLFFRLVKLAHKKNIRIILDGVFNHTGLNFWAFKDVQKNGPQSPYKDWYIIKSWDNPSTAQNEFDYAGWAGVRELPELAEDANGLVPPVRRHIFAAVHKWMDPNHDGDPSDGIDGWRLDVAEMIGHPFWKKFRVFVKNINPDAYITGEIFWDDWSAGKYMDPKSWLRGDQFDGVMNYRWAVAMCDFFINHKKKISASAFAARLKKLDQSYPLQTRYQLLNLLDSHDTDRIASHIVNPDLFYDKMVTLHDNPAYDVRRPRDDEWRILRLMALVQMTFPGPPMIYYGTEAGMWGADDPDERKPMVWPDLVYETETASIGKTPRPADPVVFNRSLCDYYTQIIHLRNSQPALQTGAFEFNYINNEKDQMVYSRSLSTDRIYIAVNNASQKDIISFTAEAGIYLDLLNGKRIKSNGKMLNAAVPAKAAVVLKKVVL